MKFHMTSCDFISMSLLRGSKFEQVKKTLRRGTVLNFILYAYSIHDGSTLELNMVSARPDIQVQIEFTYCEGDYS